MKKVIRYTFCDGTVNEYEVDCALFAVHEQLEKSEKSNERRETRRHISLNYLNDSGMDFEDNGGNPLSTLLRQEENATYEKIFGVLSDEQRELLEMIYIDGKTMTEIAKQKGVSQQAISKRIAVIIKKLKKSF